MSRILVIEDEEVIRRQLAKLLARHGYSASEAGSVEEAEAQGWSTFDLIITDVRLPGADGTEVLRKAGAVPVLVMTSYASIRSAVECIQQGAADYVAKPFDHDEMLLTVRRVLDQARLRRQNAALRSDVQRDYPSDGMVGESPATRAWPRPTSPC